MVRLSSGIEHGRVYANVGGVTISDSDCNVTVSVYVLICLFLLEICRVRLVFPPPVSIYG